MATIPPMSKLASAKLEAFYSTSLFNQYKVTNLDFSMTFPPCSFSCAEFLPLLPHRLHGEKKQEALENAFIVRLGKRSYILPFFGPSF